MDRTWLIVTGMAFLASPWPSPTAPRAPRRRVARTSPPGDRVVHDHADPPLVDVLLGDAPGSHGGNPKVIRQYVDGNLNDCNFDGTGGEYDGHHERSGTLWALLAVDPCGDFEADQSTDCVGTCTVTFPGGLDGAYRVLVSRASTGGTGLAGHVVS